MDIHSSIFTIFFSKAQLEKLQAQIAAAAKKTGISSATKLAMITPSKELQQDTIPAVEWWDAAVMPNMKYETYLALTEQDKPKHLQGLTSYIEHPVQSHPPGWYTLKGVGLHAVVMAKRHSVKLCPHYDASTSIKPRSNEDGSRNSRTRLTANSHRLLCLVSTWS